MLGKGLESLIPQKGNQGQGSDENANVHGNANMPAAGAGADQNPHPGANLNPSPIPAAIPEHAPQPVFLPAEERPQPLPAPIVAPPQQPFQSQPQPSQQPRPRPQQQPPAIAPAQKKDELAQESIFHIELDKITPNPDQPRRNYDPDGLRELANSIREFGFLQPLVVSQVKKESSHGIDVEYQIIAGERRYMAARMLGLPRVPAIVRNVSLEREKLELGVIENIQREDLNPIEMARAFQRLQEEFRMTQREIAAKLGKSREVVANSVRLLDLPEDIQTAVEKGEVSESNARMLLALEDPGAQRRLLDDIIQNKLTTRDVRERIQRFAFLGGTQGGAANGSPANGAGAAAGTAAPSSPRRGRPPLQEVHLAPEVKMLQDELSTELGAPIEIHKTAHNGRISITFFSEEELENILRKLGGKE